MAEQKHEVFTKIFQVVVLKTLATNTKFAVQYSADLLPEYFDGAVERTILTLIKDYIAKYERELNLTRLVEEIDHLALQRGLDGAMVDLLVNEAKTIFEHEAGPEEYVVDKLTEFCRRQAMKQALREGVEMLRDNGTDYAKIGKMVDTALAVGTGNNLGYFFEDLYEVQDMYEEKYRPEELIRTGFPSLDQSFKGGMAPGEVHSVIGPPKTGKSSFMTSVSAYNIMVGKTVFHISLEISAVEVLAKIAARISNLTLDEIFDQKSSEYKRRMEKFKKKSPNLYVNHWTEGSVDALTIRGWISKIRAMKGVKPDLIVIDYDDCLLPIKRGGGGKKDGADGMYEAAGEIYNDLKALAHYFQCPVLTASQPNRAAWNKYDQLNEMIMTVDLAHSAKKAMKATSFFSLNFKKDDDFGYMYVDIVRRGVGNRRIPLKRMLERAAFVEGHDGASEDEG